MLKHVSPAAIFAALLTLAPALAMAADTASCSDFGYVNRWEGYVTDWWPGHRFGLRSFLDDQTLNLCRNPRVGEGSGSFALVNREGAHTPTGYNIVQIGFGQCRGPGVGCPAGMRDVYSWGQDNCPGPNVAPTPHFLSTFSGGSLFSAYYLNGAYHLTTDEGVHVDVGNGQVCWLPGDATVFNETWDFGDALGGSSANQFAFSSLAFQVAEGGAWQWLSPTICNVTDPNAAFHCLGFGSAHRIETWTDR